MLKLYDTYKKNLVPFESLEPNKVGLYTCGLTVYDYGHIGNFRAFLFGDLLKRSLTFLGYHVHHVQNITDVGHLSSDADEGEDKMHKGATREQKTVWDIAEMYTQAFIKDAASLNLLPPTEMPRATQHIPEIIEIVAKLLEKGAAYETAQAIYFDITKFPPYESLTGQKLEDKIQAARDEVVTDPEKRHPADFAVWFKTVGKHAHHDMRWDSPWGSGFPGWHIECSAMSRKYLGQPFDIHTGGIDHITVHHPNEIAQSTVAFDAPLATYWLHSEFLTVDGQKMGKSLGNLYTLADLAKQNFSPLDYRYLTLTAHYRTRLNFTWESLTAAQRALSNLRQEVRQLGEPSQPNEDYLKRFGDTLAENLNVPKALSLAWELLKDQRLEASIKRATINAMDRVFGLDLDQEKTTSVPTSVLEIVEQRNQARAVKDWAASDNLRQKIEDFGFTVEDGPDGSTVRQK